ncbi:MAG TPA: hypothetical protein VE959_35825 [Bryobacteraceae bacterium]|nr:hypothetical protein [Bryobacteraceae bacterium]
MFLRLLLVAILAATLAPAQRGGGGGGGGGGRGGSNTGASMPMRTQRQSSFDLFSEKLKLSKDQSAEAGKILADAAGKATPLRPQLDKSRADIAGAIIDAKSPDEIKKLMDDHTALMAQMDAIEADAFSQIFATLKPNQQSKAGQAFELMAAMLDRPAGGGGGGGGGGGRRGR